MQQPRPSAGDDARSADALAKGRAMTAFDHASAEYLLKDITPAVLIQAAGDFALLGSAVGYLGLVGWWASRGGQAEVAAGHR